MKIITEIPSSSLFLDQPIALTLGSFDGLHLGHQAILHRLKYLTRNGGTSCVVTFKNHPKTLLHPDNPLKHLATFEHKLWLLRHFNIDLTLLLDFTSELAEMPYDIFIQNLRNALPFSFFILGQHAAFGKNKEGDEPHLKTLGDKWGFQVEYLKKLCNAGKVISSGRIRSLLEKGSLREAEILLGRPYSIYLSQLHFKQLDGYYKADIDRATLCLLPPGLYALKISEESKHFPGLALIGSHAMAIYGNVSMTPPVEFIFLGKISESINPDQKGIEEGLKRSKQLIANSTWHF